MINFSSVINSDKPVLVDFFATWCEPCKWLDPILDELEPIVADKVTIQRINIDLHPELKKQFSIMSVPVLMIFKNGNPVWRMNGFLYANDLAKKIAEFV
jgi:thioredoxin 1